MKNKEQAPRLKKRTKNKSIHAAGLIIGDAQNRLTSNIETNTFLTTPDMQFVEECGLIKYDFLAIGFPDDKKNDK